MTFVISHTKETSKYLLQQLHIWLPLGGTVLFFTVSNQSCISWTFCPSHAEFSLPLPWQSVQAHTNIITKFYHIHKFPLYRAMEAPPCVHRLQQSEWSDISNVPTVILFGIQSEHMHGCNPHGGGHGGLRYCGIELFFMRYFSNFNFNVQYCGIIYLCGMRVFIILADGIRWNKIVHGITVLFICAFLSI